VSKMESKTNFFSRRLKQFRGLTRLTLTPHILRQIYTPEVIPEHRSWHISSERSTHMIAAVGLTVSAVLLGPGALWADSHRFEYNGFSAVSSIVHDQIFFLKL